MSTGLSQINRVLNQIPKRAEQRQTEQLRDTFVDSGVGAAFTSTEVVYGVTGTDVTELPEYGVSP